MLTRFATDLISALVNAVGRSTLVVRRRRYLLTSSVLALAGTAAGCVQSPAEFDGALGVWEGKSQCGGSWDVQDVESYNGTLGVSQAFVARQQRHVGYHVGPGCSGTLISNDLFLSAGHCGYQAGDVVRFNYQDAPNGTPRATTDFTVTAVVEQVADGTWDYAIVRLAGEPGRTFGFAKIAPTDPPAGTLMTIIGHPNRVPKVVHAGQLLDYSSSIGANWFRHQVDTVGGSSGSGVLNTAGQLVGVHTNAGCRTTAPIEGNSAIRMSRLVEQSTTLRNLVRGSMLISDSNTGLAINALGGAHHGGAVVLHSGCVASNPDCTWTYRDGMLLSDRDQRLAINAWGGAAHGKELKLHDGCTSTNPDCTWTLKNGVFYSDSNPALAINAWDGAHHLGPVKLHSGCTAGNPDCTWTYKNVLARSETDMRFAANAFGGAAFGTALKLHDACASDNADCTFTITKGRILSDRNTSLAANAFGGAASGTSIALHNACLATNTDCTFTFKKGMVLSDTNSSLAVNAFGGAAFGTNLKLNNACTQANGDCRFQLTGR
jgi:V8-like Glu-specific endopeptidase